MAKKIKVICDTCGKEIEKYENRVGKNNFCDRNCYNKFHSQNTIEIKCDVCGKVFTKNKNDKNHFCSRECYNKVHFIKNKSRQCLTCGKIFEARNSKHVYCSKECYNKNRINMPRKEQHWNWQGGISLINDNRDSTEYKQWRNQVYKKDNYKCVICGSKEKLNAHHKKSWKEYPELRYDVDNGETFCEKCHIKYHQLNGY